MDHDPGPEVDRSMRQVEAPRRPAWRPGELWREPDFLRLWSAQAISALGSRITRTALPILAVLSIGAGADQVAILSAVAVAPGVLVGLAMGGRVDRQAKRPLLIGADLIRAGLLLTVPLAAWLGRLGMGQLYLVAGLCGAATTLFQIADNAYLPALIGKDRLIEGNSKLESTEAVAEIVGPGLGGILVQAITAPLAIVFDSLSFLASAIMLGAIHRKEAPASGASEGERSSLIHDIRVGLRASVGHPLVGPEFLVEALSALSNGFFLSLYTLYALRTLRLSPGTLGVVISVGGVGALAGTALAGRMSRRLGLGPALIVCLSGARLAALLIPMARGPEWLALTCLVGHQLLGDALLMGYYVLATSLRQSVLPQEVLGRANATFHVAAGLLLPLGALIAGPIATATGVRTALWISAVVGLAAPLILQLSAVRRVRSVSDVDLACEPA
jgi:predicted MFS family arabinose efflux permease